MDLMWKTATKTTTNEQPLCVSKWPVDDSRVINSGGAALKPWFGIEAGYLQNHCRDISVHVGVE